MTEIKRDLGKFEPTGYDKGRNILWQISWHIVSHLIFKPFWVPSPLRIFILRLFGARVGNNVIIRANVKIHWPWKIDIGDNSWLGQGASIINLEHISIGSSVCVSQEALICSGSHDPTDETFRLANKPIILSNGVWVCARAMVLAGSNVPANTIVSAGTIFTHKGNAVQEIFHADGFSSND